MTYSLCVSLCSHEVRNPLSAAISAATFVNASVQAKKTLTDEAQKTLKEDVSIIEASLRFINDLLRSMLDVHRAANNQLVLDEDSVDILHDIFEPVSALIYNRDTNFEVLLECPEGLHVTTDRLRLHQVVLNLARNAAKFVESGFIRLRADVIDNSVHLFIEDTGPGIPVEKRDKLFSKFQKSLDTLAQGTGVGLNLCMKLVGLMGGEIYLDESYDSCHGGNPGARIVINLNRGPEIPDATISKVKPDSDEEDVFSMDNDIEAPSDDGDDQESSSTEDIYYDLPRELSILFVDDDRILRKQGIRAVCRLMPEWKVREAANGETALKLVDTETFDIIFMDQYMTSVQQNMTGTETTRALRSKGVTSIVCGLSANNLEGTFLDAGANAFCLKPFPCKNEELRVLLKDLLATNDSLQSDRHGP
jgi:CheY-like chemotaxis protein